MDLELMTSLSSELKNLGPWKKTENNRVDGTHGNF